MTTIVHLGVHLGIHLGLAGGMFSHPFVRHAFVAGTAIATASGLVGYFLVLRSELFTADALSHVTFTGALAALAFGVDVRLGLFAGAIGVALILGALGQRRAADDVTIGSVFAWILGLGVLFLSIFTSRRATTNSTAGVNVLFGSIFGIDASRARVALVVALCVCALMATIARPLLFASIDWAVAAARGIPVRALSYGFLVLVGITAAEATQAFGALLLLGLLAAPAGAALRLTARPYRGLLVSALLAVSGLWLGLVVSYNVSRFPPSFSIMAILSLEYVIATAISVGSRRIVRRGRVSGR